MEIIVKLQLISTVSLVDAACLFQIVLIATVQISMECEMHKI